MPEKHAEISEDKRATEYLANERTFLAWIRTSISIIGIGAALTKVSPFLQQEATAHKLGFLRITSSLPIGIGMICFGALMTILAARRYHTVNLDIERGKVKADHGLIVAISVLVVILAIAMIFYLIMTAG